ncbi:hypothetical protein HYH03_003562 [Edaphochlamys debaryana]|uniref:Uncharacterized protein n=1 Tax=Edaphochlamys debaryana TaxID=47281 RepID=A0A835Y957_9CHLO|nr:hypothetical protein HYH03_003562 [Edaphochlamys debaryana]|eukprot:KAG2498301.1 hypothetical protein HYH03_003562 [Edaphochlamys debaryana]
MFSCRSSRAGAAASLRPRAPLLCALLAATSLLVSLQTANAYPYDDAVYYYEDGAFNGTGDGDYPGGGGHGAGGAVPRGPGQYDGYGGFLEDSGPKVWSVQLQEGGEAGGLDGGAAGFGGVGAGAGEGAAAGAGAAAPGAPGMGAGAPLPGGKPRGVGWGGGFVRPPSSCPNGVCPNPEPEYELHYDPRFPYDNCNYVGDFSEFVINGTETCSLLVQGVDGHADRLEGGMDGLYLLAGCFEGKPVYLRRRLGYPEGEDRVLYFNPNFGAWEFSVGREPNVDQLVLAGDEGHVSPIDVPRWHLAAAFNSDQASLLPSEDEELFYVAAGVSVMCGDEGDDSLLLPPGERPGRRQGRGEGAGAGAGKRAGKAGGAGAGAGGRGVGGKGGRGRGGARGERGPARSGERGGEGGGGGAGAGAGPRAGANGGGTAEGGAGGAEGSDPEEALQQEIAGVRDYWRDHEEQFYEMRYEYGANMEYGDGAQGYDDGYGGMY